MTKQYGLNPTTLSLLPSVKASSTRKYTKLLERVRIVCYFGLKSGCLFEVLGFLAGEQPLQK